MSSGEVQAVPVRPPVPEDIMKSESHYSNKSASAAVTILSSLSDTGSYDLFLESQVDAAVRAAHKGRQSAAEQTQSSCSFCCVDQKTCASESSEHSEEERGHESGKSFWI